MIVGVFQDMTSFILWRDYYHLIQIQPSPAQVDYLQGLHWRSHRTVLNIAFELGHVQNEIQEPCRIALLIFRNASNQVNRPGSVLYQTIATRLVRALSTTDLQSFQGRFPELLTWLLLLGAFITVGQPEYQWFARSIASNLRHREVCSWDETESVLLRSLYVRRIFGRTFAQAWKVAICLLAHQV